jgi:hypothetical protein
MCVFRAGVQENEGEWRVGGLVFRAPHKLGVCIGQVVVPTDSMVPQFQPELDPQGTPTRLGLNWAASVLDPDPAVGAPVVPLPNITLTLNGQGMGPTPGAAAAAGPAQSPSQVTGVELVGVRPLPPLVCPVPLVGRAHVSEFPVAAPSLRPLLFPLFVTLSGLTDTAVSGRDVPPAVVFACAPGEQPWAAMCTRLRNTSRPVLAGDVQPQLSYSFNGRDWVVVRGSPVSIQTVALQFRGPRVVVMEDATTGPSGPTPLVLQPNGTAAQVSVLASGLSTPNATLWFGDVVGRRDGAPGSWAVQPPVVESRLVSFAEGSYLFTLAVPVNEWCEPSKITCEVPVCLVLGQPGRGYQALCLAQPFTYVGNVTAMFPRLPFPLRGPQVERPGDQGTTMVVVGRTPPVEGLATTLTFQRDGVPPQTVAAQYSPLLYTVGVPTATNVAPASVVPPTLGGPRSTMQFLLTLEDLMSAGVQPGTEVWQVDVGVGGPPPANAVNVSLACGNTSRAALHLRYTISGTPVPVTTDVAMVQLLAYAQVGRVAMAAAAGRPGGWLRLTLSRPLVVTLQTGLLCELGMEFVGGAPATGNASNSSAAAQGPGLRMRLTALPQTVVVEGLPGTTPARHTPLSMLPFVRFAGDSLGSLASAVVPHFPKKASVFGDVYSVTLALGVIGTNSTTTAAVFPYIAYS